MTVPAFKGSATFSPCKRYRYTLERDFFASMRSTRRITFVMLNPSTADADANDPTVNKCCKYALAWGFGHLTVVNIFAFRATDPRALRTVDDPVGADNQAAILRAAEHAEMVLCAWGSHGVYRDRGQLTRDFLRTHDLGPKMHVLALTNSGQPGHPLYLRDALQPKPWSTP